MPAKSDLDFQYLFDPLCGWCYASAPAFVGLADAYGSHLRVMPTGLFCGQRPVASIADHAWRNDRRIAELTGQCFSEDYHRNVLLAPEGIFDSTALTCALVGLGELDRVLEPRFLHRAQIARYVEGRDTSRPETAAEIAGAVACDAGLELDVDRFAERLRYDQGLRAATAARIAEAEAVMRRLGASGVPLLVLRANDRRHIITGQDLYSGAPALLARIAAIVAAA